MENKFYTDDHFEHFLKDATDNFRMYPSKKVWYSIYNDLHPSRRWPSLAVCLLLITAILFVGVSNNNMINRSSKTTLATGTFAVADPNIIDNKKTASPVSGNDVSGVSSDVTEVISNPSSFYVNEGNLAANLNMPASSGNSTSAINSNPATRPLANADIIPETIAEPVTALRMETGSSTSVTITQPSVEIASETVTYTDDADNVLPDNNSIAATSTPATISTTSQVNALNPLNAKAVSLNKEMSVEDKAWIENFAFNNKASISKFKANASIEYYVTPSVGFRFLKKNNDFEAPDPAAQGFVSPNEAPRLNINDEVTQKSAVNMEAGVSLLYNISKKVRLKTGIQLNYTSYISFADELKHPTQTYLMMNTEGGYSIAPRASSYANSITGDKNQRLNNKTVQLSLPIGADIKLAGRNNLKWYAGATIQPSFITGGQMFAISADTKNYVEEPSLLRKFNMNTAIETFISFKTPSGIIINAGPQLRYQLLSTYNKQYSYTEKLYNIGIKLGITKSF